jgi:hypothetical protein
MGVRAMVFSFRSVIVNNLNIQWARLILRPLKTYAPLVIDPNAWHLPKCSFNVVPDIGPAPHRPLWRGPALCSLEDELPVLETFCPKFA